MRIKICGITTVADAELAASLGADAIGLNFYAQSPRCIDAARAEEVLHALPATVEPVAVMVSPTPEDIRDLCLPLGLLTVQLHAAGPSRSLAQALTSGSVRVLLAVGVKDEADVRGVASRLAAWQSLDVNVIGVLTDARVEGLHGGTGRSPPWDLLSGFDPGVPVYLAGGLTPENVAQAIRAVRPFAVDVASGVEASPGRKDPDKLRRFMENARAAADL